MYTLASADKCADIKGSVHSFGKTLAEQLGKSHYAWSVLACVWVGEGCALTRVKVRLT